jgi:membrane-associated protein
MERFVAWFLGISGAWAVAAVFLVPALETALVLGLMFPGEVVVILGGVLAARGDAPLWAILIAGVLGPIAGDTIGYLLGRRYGEEVVRRKLKKRWSPAHRWLSKKGGGAIFLGRFLPFLRSVLPTAAGAMGITPRHYLSRDLLAAGTWGTASVLLGYFAARDFERVLRFANRFGLILLGLVLVVTAWMAWRRRTQSRHKTRRSRGILARFLEKRG